MADQSFLDGLRTQAGLGMGSYTRTADARSADQNSTQSGNPMQYAPTTRQPFVAPQAANNRRAPNTIPSTPQQAYSGAYQPGMYQPQQGLYGQALAAMPNVGGFSNPGAGALGTMMGAPGMQMNGGVPGQPSRFVAPQAAMNGGGPVPDQLAQRNVMGSRFVRPMIR